VVASTVRYYPLFLDLRNKSVLIVGAGKIALRKARGAVEAGARVKVVAPRVDPGFVSLGAQIEERPFKRTDVGGHVLVFTATDDRAVNAEVAAEAKRFGIPVNVADSREECDFLVPSRVNHAGVQIAISTGGKSPRKAAEMRRRIQSFLARG
jgi:siroheme synthase-like protein